MEQVAIFSLLSAVAVSIISLLVAIPLFMKKKISKKFLVVLLSMSVGVLLATVFIDFLPEIYGHEHEHGEDNVLLSSLVILLGFIVMFLVEKFVHFHHTNKCEHDDHGHSHAYHLAPINLIGDGIHNFIDALVIVGAYSVNVTLGIAATISIIFHEIPQEIADFGILLYSGMSKKKALLFNFLSALTSIIGVIFGLFLLEVEGFSEFVLPFAAGTFLYIAASNLVPQLHRHCKLKETFIHVLAIILGVCIILMVSVFGPGHMH